MRQLHQPMSLRVLVVACALLAPGVASTSETDGARRMGEVAQAFEALDTVLRGQLPAAALDPARRLQLALTNAAEVRPQRNLDDRAVFDRYLERARKLSTEILGVVEEGNADRAAELLGDVRTTCVSCHVRFREETPELGLFPGRPNVLSGVVRVTTEDGVRKDDASNVVVFVDGLPESNYPPPVTPAVVSQRDRMFEPRVLPIVKGTTVTFPNDDTIFHNAFSLSRTRPFDLGIYEHGESKAVIFDESGLVRVYCNIHPNMVLNIVVLENPFFAVTDTDGHFVITDIPDGEFVLRTWYEFGDEMRRPLAISGSTHVQADLDVVANKSVVAHRNKFGKPYRAKY